MKTTNNNTAIMIGGNISAIEYPNDDEYFKDLARRQKEHLQQIGVRQFRQRCLHDGCSECVGTGVRKNGGACVHMISCPCPRCSPTCTVL